MPANENFYEYEAAEPTIIPALKQLSLDAYKSCGGKGYTRIDIRQDSATGKLYMLEANAQCGLSDDEDYTSIGAILKVSNVSFTEVIAEILKDALRRSVLKPLAAKKSKDRKIKKSISIK
jgi:D-alanine-D-alanine ligase